MTKIKIISNPYTREIKYSIFNDFLQRWDDIQEKNPNSRLREDVTGKAFLPFKIKEIIDVIVSEYATRDSVIAIEFEGTKDEYLELEEVCHEYDKIQLTRSNRYLANARFICKEAKETFETVQPIIASIIRDDKSVIKDLNKVSDALKDIIPICVFGNYSSGKSTFINALIGNEILPSGGDPVTAKIYKITKSDQPDYARICFDYLDTNIDIRFEGNDYRIISGDINTSLLNEVTEAIQEKKMKPLVARINAALVVINGYEKRDKTSIEIGSIIELEMPFSKNGILGQSDNTFVIFDTPGSNSASNIDHEQVLAEAMDGFSNGIPVWVSTHETMDTNDNAELCAKVLDINALDKRFTMIVVNKADGADLPREGFSDRQIQDILEYTAVEKMYSSGIFFVSSIMGLGAKNDGNFTDNHYRKTYRVSKEMFSDPDDMDYVALYRFNIMPDQIKTKIIDYSERCNDIIYANSGLLCIEMAMESFASKYAAYNKCQMVYWFLNKVITETNKRIEKKTEFLNELCKTRNKELDDEKKGLLDAITQQTQDSDQQFEAVAKAYIKQYIADKIDYSHTLEEVNTFDERFRTEYTDNSSYDKDEADYEQSMSDMWSNFIANGQNLFKRKSDIFERIKQIGADLARDYKDVQEKRVTRDSSSREIDKKTSDRLMNLVSNEYKKNMSKAKNAFSTELHAHWQENSQVLRNQLIDIIAGTDALSESQRDEISSIILEYEQLEFDDDADNIFIKKKFLRKNVFGESEKINNRRLIQSYNDKISKNSKALALYMNDNCRECFRTWQQSLCDQIEANITEYNPKLREMAALIRDDKDKVRELEDNRKTISAALDAINELMSWKEDEFVE